MKKKNKKEAALKTEGMIFEVPIKSILPGKNPRKELGGETFFRELGELKESMKQQGLLSPIIVRQFKDGASKTIEYQIVAGNRRLMAAKALGWVSIRAIDRGQITDDEAREIALVENVQRVNLPAGDEARALNELEKLGKNKLQIAERVGKSPQYVADRIFLTRLPGELLDRIGPVGCPVRGATAIARLEDEKDRKEAAREIVRRLKGGDTVTESDIIDLIDENFARNLKNAPFAKGGKTPYAPACTDCPSNSAKQPGLFDDDTKPEKGRCLNATCFARKAQGYAEDVIKKAKEKGFQVLKGKEAQTALRNYNSGMQKLDDTVWIDDENVSLRKIKKVYEEKTGKEIKVTVAVDPDTGRTFELVKRSELDEASKVIKLGPLKKAEKVSNQEKAERKAANLKQRVDREAKMVALERVARKAEKLFETREGRDRLLAALMTFVIGKASYLDGNAVRKRRELKTSSSWNDGLETLYRKMKSSEAVGLAFEAAAAGDVLYGQPAKVFPSFKIDQGECLREAKERMKLRAKENHREKRKKKRNEKSKTHSRRRGGQPLRKAELFWLQQGPVKCLFGGYWGGTGPKNQEEK